MSNRQNPYAFLQRYCLRTPIYSLNFYKTLISRDRFNINDLKVYWDDALFREAIFLASPELYSEIEKLLGDTNYKKAKRIKQTIFKYLVRASTRCTPFGLFSGIHLATIGGQKKPVSTYKRTTTFDTNYLFTLSSHLSKTDHIQKQLMFFPNSSLYKTANLYRYVEYQFNGNKRTYSVEATEATDYLDRIISESKHGKTIDQLIHYLLEEDISYDEAKDYIDILIDNQILVSELYPNVTGNTILPEIISVLEKYNTDTIIEKLKSLQKLLDEIDQNLGNDKSAYGDIIKEVKELNIPFEKKYLFQSDLSIQRNLKPLSINEVHAIKKTIPLLIRLNPYDENEHLKQFKNAFLERYGDQEVSLASALDIESGVGYVQHSGISDVTPFLQDITPSKTNSSSKKESFFDECQEIIYAKLIEAQQNKNYAIEITDKDVEHLELIWNHIPDTLSAFVEIVTGRDKAQIVLHGFGNGAGKLLARFCNGNQDVQDHTMQIAAIEQSLNPDKILAEIVHLPESRTGNILKRPHLRPYEIPYIAKSTLPLSNQLQISDLVVSVSNNKVILKSKRLQKEVLPRLTNAHNYSPRALPIYHFLCDLELQSKRRHIGFTWPEIAYEFTFLPRVSYKNIILSKAKWIISKETIQEMITQPSNENLLDWIVEWRKKYNIPEYVQLMEGDNALLIKLTHLESVRLFADTIKNKNNVTLEEFLHIKDDTIKEDSERFSNEYIITFYNEKAHNGQ